MPGVGDIDRIQLSGDSSIFKTKGFHGGSSENTSSKGDYGGN